MERLVFIKSLDSQRPQNVVPPPTHHLTGLSDMLHPSHFIFWKTQWPGGPSDPSASPNPVQILSSTDHNLPARSSILLTALKTKMLDEFRSRMGPLDRLKDAFFLANSLASSGKRSYSNVGGPLSSSQATADSHAVKLSPDGFYIHDAANYNKNANIFMVY